LAVEVAPGRSCRRGLFPTTYARSPGHFSHCAILQSVYGFLLLVIEQVSVIGTAAPYWAVHSKEEIMKFIVEASFPAEPFNTYVREGVVGEKIGAVLGSIKAETTYFTDAGVGRGVLMIVDLADMSQLPHITEPLMLNFDAAVHYRIAISPDELQAAGLERYATA
jgi:hypothetical protein